MNANLTLILALCVPLAGVVYMGWQIRVRDLRGWQHYACLTSLLFLISIMFLIAGGRIESFGLGGNTVKLVDQKLDEMKRLTEQNKRIAKATAELGLVVASPFAAPEVPEIWQESRKKLILLLQEAGQSDEQINQFLNEIDSRYPKTNAVPPAK